MTLAAASVPAALADLPSRIVFFDGVCSFCDGSVRWLVEHDPERHLHFAPLQGDTAATVRAAFPDCFPTDIDTIVYYRPGPDGRPAISLRAQAIFEILREVGGGWRWLSVLRFLPASLSELGYRIFARNRYRIFGRLEACALPSPDDAEGDQARILA
jgi:predicted DCC family thiol-disulfide oxidoreductase YuxK